MKQEKSTVKLEGLHVCKHAVRFKAEILEFVTPNNVLLKDMLQIYAPDLLDRVLSDVQEVTDQEFAEYSDLSVRTPLSGKAVIPHYSSNNLHRTRPIVFLENPRDLENIGAVVRVSAGMDAAGVVTTGDVNPWHKNCLRGSQGLHFALPVIHQEMLTDELSQNRTIVVFDETGQDLTATHIPLDSILVFGSERQGVTALMLEKADVVVKIPQQEGVSSYNLATSVAMGLYHVLHNRSL